MRFQSESQNGIFVANVEVTWEMSDSGRRHTHEGVIFSLSSSTIRLFRAQRCKAMPNSDA